MMRSGSACLRLAMLLVLSCGRGREVVPYTSVDQVFSEPVFRAFEHTSEVEVRAVFDTEETKSTGVLNRILMEAGHPQADLFWSGDPVRPFLLIARGLVEPYRSPAASAIPDTYKSADGSWTGFAARARVLLVNRRRLGGRPPPATIRDLADPRWRGEAAIANPLFGTTTMHAAALFAAWGDRDAERFFEDLRNTGVAVASSNGEVERLVSGGQVTFGLTDTDDAYSALAAGEDVTVVYPDQDGLGTLVMPTVVVLLRNAPHPEAARALIDFLLSPEVERQLAESGAHMAVHGGVPPPKGMRALHDIRAMAVDYSQVGQVMERIQPWLRTWAGL